MPIQTDLNISPYFDDFDESKDFYKILFRPGFAVQTRELNQLQTLLQKQVERFGNYVLQAGTVVSGCALTYHSYVPYVKLKDTTNDGGAVDPEGYVGLFVKSETSGLIGEVVKAATGYESQNPDLATLYLNYKNEGTTGNTSAFSASDILKVYNKDERLYSVKVVAGSTGFSNNDAVVIQSALELQNTTGGATFSTPFTVGEVVTQTTTGAQGIVLSTNATANSDALVMSVKPLANQLSQANTLSWAWDSGKEITGANSGATANVVGFVGSGATASLVTAAAGRVANVNVVTQGSLYYVTPHVTISSSTANSGQISGLSLTAKNYLANVTVSALSGSVGQAYGMTVDDGIIYQKGYFSRVSNQFAIIEKYSNTPHEVAVGFNTIESIVNAAADSTLLDNATGQLNVNAPGADRLKLTPVLSATTKLAADEDEDFLTLVEFTNGNPHIKVNTTELGGLGDELARRTYEESGNYVLDPFQATTTDRDQFADTSNTFSLIIDPGLAYLNGYRIQSTTNYTEFIDKAKDSDSVVNTSIDIVYGNYVKVNEVGGMFVFNEGSQLSLRDTAADYLTTDPTATPVASGVEIGKARMRSLVYDSGEPGTPNCVYRLYLFDIIMNAGKNFRDVKSVFYDSTYDGIADLILETDPSTGSSIAVVKDPTDNSLIFGQDKIKALKSANSLSYTYRTCNTSLTANAAGVIVATAGAGEEWPYAGVLTSTEKRDVVVVPRDIDIIAAANIAGSMTTAANGLVTGTSTAFLTDLAIGDYITINDGANSAVERVTSIINNTSMYVTNVANLALISTANAVITFPVNVPVSLSTHSRSVNVVSTALNINLGTAITGVSNVAVTFNSKITSASPVTKTVNRKSYIKIQANTHTDGVAGPWCIGFSDVIRLRAVYAGANTSATNITKHFYIDNNHNTNYYDLGYLYKLPESTYTIGADDVLLVEFDHLTHSTEGIKTLGSYNINDTLPLANLDSTGEMHTLEIPEFISEDNKYYDLRDSFDFRPRTANTVAIQTVAASAPTNPAEVTEATRFVAGGKKFPVPESDLFLNYEFYTSRVDTVMVTSENEFIVLKDELRQTPEKDELNLFSISIPAYPSLAENPSSDMIEIMDVKTGTRRYDSIRVPLYTVDTKVLAEQPRGYTMKDIGQLERRIESLEYYSQLSLIEDKVKDKVIPSSLDGTINRFKFGFFVDNYTTDNYSNLTDPEYNATVYQYKLHPSRQDLDIELRFTNTNSGEISGLLASLPYEEYNLTSQKNVTDGVVTANGTTTANTTDPNYKVQYIFTKNGNSKYKSNPSSNTDTVYEDKILKLAANSEANGQSMAIYFNALGGKDRIEVYQSTDVNGTYVAIANTESCRAATQAEINDIRNRKLYGDFNFGAKTFTRLNSSFRTNYWVINSGVLDFTYDISKGRYLKIRTVKGSPNHYYATKYVIDDLGTPSATGNLTIAPKIATSGVITTPAGYKNGTTTSVTPTPVIGSTNNSKPPVTTKPGFNNTTVFTNLIAKIKAKLI